MEIGEYKDYVFKKLDTYEEINMAEHLLYKIYVEERNWFPTNNNPSNYKVKSLNFLICLYQR